jgi:hypothetical protein
MYSYHFQLAKHEAADNIINKAFNIAPAPSYSCRVAIHKCFAHYCIGQLPQAQSQVCPAKTEWLLALWRILKHVRLKLSSAWT